MTHQLPRSLPAATRTTAAFAILHLPGWPFMNGATLSTLLSVLNVAAVGMVLAAIAWRVPSLLCAILIHVVHYDWDQDVVLAPSGADLLVALDGRR